MFTLPDSYQRAVAALPGFTLPASTSDVISSTFAAQQAEDFPEVMGDLLSQQEDALAKAGLSNLPSAGAVANALQQGKGGIIPAQRLVDIYNQGIAAAKLAHPELTLHNTDELTAQAAEQAKQAQATASEISSRASTSANVIGGLVGGTAATFTDPTQLAVMMALPIDSEAFAGNLLLRVGKSALTQAAVQGATALTEDVANRDFYRAQGMTDDQISAQTWRSVVSAAAGGAVINPLLDLGGMAAGKALGWLAHGSLAERQAAVDALQKTDLGTNANADLANTGEVLGMEAKNPLPPSPASNRLFMAAIDDTGRAIQDGSYDPYVAASALTEGAVRAYGDGIPFRLPDEVIAELGLTTPPKAPEEINAALQSNIARGMVQSAQGEADQAAARIADAESQVAQMEAQRAAFAAEAEKPIPSANALRQGGLDEGTAALLDDIEQQLAGRLSKKQRVALEAQRESVIQSSADEIAAAKQGISDRVDELDQQLTAANREVANATRTKANADNEIARLQKIAEQADRHLANIRNAKVPEPPIDAEPDVIRQATLDEIRDRRAEMRRPMTSDEVQQVVSQSAESQAHATDIVDDVRADLAKQDVEMPIVEGGDYVSAREELARLDEREAALQEMLTCMGE